MKATTLNARLLKLDVNKTTIAYQIAKELTGLCFQNSRYGIKKLEPVETYMIFGDIIRPVKLLGRGRFAHYSDYTTDICNILTSLKIKFEVGNDASRGGLTGNFIKIITKIEN
jgi:hypothetical protein